MSHAAGDRMPHGDIPSERFELVTGVGLGVFVMAARGPTSPEALGAFAACAPDLEHVLPLPRPGGRKLFPTHRFEGWHRAGGIPAWAQLVAAGLILGVVLAPRRGVS
jgi:hypothetical protein